MRVINYPDQPDNPLPGQLRAGAHSDYGTLTILRSENVAGGLQVRDRAGAWVDVVTMPDSFVINIGDMMQYWTNDRWISTIHRVVNPPRDQNLGSRRQSIVFFHSPNENTLISCLDGCSSAANPPKYAPILAGEHLRQKSAKAGTLAETKAGEKEHRMTSAPLIYEQDGHVAVIRFNRPDKLNALTPAMMQELSRLLDLINTDDEVRCLVITGAGDRAFSVGFDLDGLR